MSPITVYSKPSCGQCLVTKKFLDKAGADYTVIDITKDSAARDKVIEMGMSQMPVVVAGNGYWSGFRDDKLREALDS